MQDKRYHISSSNRTSSSASSTNFTIIPTNQIEPLMKKLLVRRVTIPYTVYTINSNNNKLYWVDSDSSAKTSTITSGNYDENTLAAAIASQMNIDKTSVDIYTCTVNSTTAKFTITNNTNNFQLTTTSTSSAIWKVLGYTTSSNKTGSTSYTGTNVYNLQPLMVIYICSNLADGNNARVQAGDFPILCAIPISANFGNIVTYINDFGDEIPLNNTKSMFTFQLYDDNLNLIDLNGQDWTIEFAVSY